LQGRSGGSREVARYSVRGDPQNDAFMERAVSAIGAVVAGRRTYDDSLAYWGAHGPTGPRRTPVFVVTHEAPGTSPENGVYRFETGGLAAAIQAARLIARNKDVSVMGGANIGQQAIREGLVDEVAISLVPLILGGGVRLFEHLEGKQIRLDLIDILHTKLATHLTYRPIG
jgi:dihydrofolate reductase